ncbi:TlpA family protein disulfide reductase [Sphingobacterium sp. SGG-5]|uniref:TlpA family protein disulfide reductase n=1 Tax=Sphingobacterium sp. SGG-5 TaxID=2710881 RepID=UPI0013EC312A|nr:TlpA disulfide reductase family protein [Sphingobacterium sp. SGG-5]NGM61884.1 TlpA family protein disulfide reductase [Sphingobacterium sp. SGG-5]
MRVHKNRLAGLFVIMVLLLTACNNNADKNKETANETTPEATTTPSTAPTQNEVSVSATFKDEQGTIVNTADLKGKVVFINFWATWCPPCRKEMPSIQTLYNKFKDNTNIIFLIVEIENDVEGTKRFLAEGDLQLPIVYPQDDIPKEWLGGAIPTTVILDKNGVIAAKQEGMYDFGTPAVEDFIQELIDDSTTE